METRIAPGRTLVYKAPGFWQILLQDHSLDDRADLEKILTGCEIIAALDDLDLLPAQ